MRFDVIINEVLRENTYEGEKIELHFKDQVVGVGDMMTSPFINFGTGSVQLIGIREEKPPFWQSADLYFPDTPNIVFYAIDIGELDEDGELEGGYTFHVAQLEKEDLDPKIWTEWSEGTGNENKDYVTIELGQQKYRDWEDFHVVNFYVRNSGKILKQAYKDHELGDMIDF